MKDGVILINNRRGQLLVENDLSDSLKIGKVYSAGIIAEILKKRSFLSVFLVTFSTRKKSPRVRGREAPGTPG